MLIQHLIKTSSVDFIADLCQLGQLSLVINKVNCHVSLQICNDEPVRMQELIIQCCKLRDVKLTT
jgi:hypothetical protein